MAYDPETARRESERYSGQMPESQNQGQAAAAQHHAGLGEGGQQTSLRKAWVNKQNRRDQEAADRRRREAQKQQSFSETTQDDAAV